MVQDMLETRALDYTAKNIAMYTNKAKEELIYLSRNKATQTLKSFVGFQPRLFIESLSMLQT
jgi:hypothetical protein